MNRRIVIAWIATFIWASVWCYLIYSGWSKASQMTFNEWGDFFAGASAPLAFLWIVVGYFQQGVELGQNTMALKQQEEALKLQVEELRHSVEQQKIMVKVTQEDLEINRESIDREYRKEKLRSQPLIRETTGLKSTNQGYVKHKIKAKNIGHLISRVELSIHNKTIDIDLEKDFFDNWDYETEKNLVFIHQEATLLSESDSFELSLKYLDGMGEQSAQILYFTANRRGSFSFSSENPSTSTGNSSAAKSSQHERV